MERAADGENGLNSFDELVAQVSELLARDRRVAYRILKRRFELDDEDIEDLKSDLIDAKQIATDENGKVLVWAGGDAAAAAHPPVDEAAGATQESQDADRRLITVMFCDIVGSTELSGRFDAEELREIVRAYQQICTRIVSAAEGHVAQYLGDGLLVYFGYPAALEDEANRCVGAALEIMSALREDAFLRGRLGDVLRVRIGIHTGHVVIGEMGGDGREERLALGDTPNIAARVQAVARPDQILVTATTRRLVDGLYACEFAGEHQLKGVPAPVGLFAVTGDEEDFDPFETTLSTGYLSAFVGREPELAELNERFERAAAGAGEVVLLTGEAGIGKTRLVQELRQRVGDAAHHITLRCSPNHVDSAYFPFGQLARRVFGVDANATEMRQLEQLAAGLKAHDLEGAQTLGHFASLLSLTVSDTGIADDALESDPTARQRDVVDTVVGWLADQAATSPLLVVFDDVHWMDQASQEILERFMASVADKPVACFVIYRSDFDSPWAQGAPHHRMRVEPLDNHEVDALISGADREGRLTPELRRQIGERTDGIPLFVEELTRNVLDNLGDDAPRPGQLSRMTVPETLQDSLEARLDRCPVGKVVAQWGAVIGREFSYRLMRCLIEDATLLSRGIDELLDAELIYRSGTREEQRYIFKHALTRDTAYDSLLNKQRRHYHGRIAEAIEKQFPEIVEREPELVAHHLVEAGVHDRVVEHLLAAGQRAIERSAGSVAEGHFRKALKTLSALPDSPARARLELNITLLLGPLVSTAHGSAADEVATLYRRALDLCQRTDNQISRYPASFGLRAHHLARSDVQAAHDIGLSLHEAALADGSAESRLTASLALIGSLFYLGDVAGAAAHIDTARTLYDRTEHKKHTALYGLEPGGVILIREAQNRWQRGDPNGAHESLTAALHHIESIPHVASRLYVLNNAALLQGWLADHAAAAATALRAEALAMEEEIVPARVWATIERAHAEASSGGDHNAAAVVEGARQLYDERVVTAQRTHLMFPWFAVQHARILAAGGDVEQGLALLPEAQRYIEQTGVRWCEAVLLRVRGSLLAAASLNAEAERALRQAMEVARDQGNLAFELEAALALSDLAEQAELNDDPGPVLAHLLEQWSATADDALTARARARVA